MEEVEKEEKKERKKGEMGVGGREEGGEGEKKKEGWRG